MVSNASLENWDMKVGGRKRQSTMSDNWNQQHLADLLHIVHYWHKCSVYSSVHVRISSRKCFKVIDIC